MSVLGASDWIAVAAISLPLCAKVLTDCAERLDRRHQTALSRIVSVAGRQAADIARTLQSLPAGADVRTVEAALIGSAATTLQSELAASTKTVGADQSKLETIVSGEVSKLMVATPGPTPPPVVAVVPPPPEAVAAEVPPPMPRAH